MDTLETIRTFNYALIGLTGAASLLTFGAGLCVYLMRLGTERRIAGIRVMENGVRLILGTFVLIAALSILQRW